MNIRESLFNIQQKLNAPKTQYNNFGRYNYRSCEDILKAVKSLLKETETILTLNDQVIDKGDRYYIEATATLENMDGEKISIRSIARESEIKKGMDGSQITGAASSYARKYALNGLFGIDDNKDSDKTNKGAVGHPKAIKGDYYKIATSVIEKSEDNETLKEMIPKFEASKKYTDEQKVLLINKINDKIDISIKK